MRPLIRASLPVLAAAFPFLIAAACSSSDSSSEELSRPNVGGQSGAGQGGAGASAGSGQAGAGAGQAGSGEAGAGQAGDAGSGGSGQAGEAGSGQAGSGGSGQAGGGEAGQAGAGAGAGAGGSEPQAGQAGSAAGGSGGAGGSSGAGGSGGAGGGEAGSGGSGQAGSGEAGQGGSSGNAGSGGGWPTCDEQPEGSVKSTISGVWAANPASYSPVWLEGLTITAISFGACSASGNFQCLLFLQTQPGYGSLAEGKHQGIKLFVSAKASPYFAGLGVGDVVNLYGNAIRYTEFGHNELRIHVALEHPGCAKKVGSAVPTPIGGVALADLTIDNYENAIGPLLVQVDTVKGRPAPSASETFALYESESENNDFDAGLELTQVLTPYYLPGGQFKGLTPDTWTNFSSIGGVYSVFVVNSGGQALKYRMLGPRTQGEIVQQP